MPNMLISPASRQLAVLHRCPTARRQYFDNEECRETLLIRLCVGKLCY